MTRERIFGETECAFHDLGKDKSSKTSADLMRTSCIDNSPSVLRKHRHPVCTCQSLRRRPKFKAIIPVFLALLHMNFQAIMAFRLVSRLADAQAKVTRRQMTVSRQQYPFLASHKSIKFHKTTERLVMSSSSSSSSSSSVNMEQRTLTPGAVYESELIVKKSRFIALAKHVGSWSEAQVFVDDTKVDHPKARHWCSGFRGVVMVESGNKNVDGNDDDNGSTSSATVITERCNDDGEPSGTAGQPILNALQTEGDLVNVVCVVVRYFGGVKLGAGGLIRAYGGAARQVLREAPQEVVIPTSSFVASKIAAQYVGAVYDCVSKFGGTTADETYDDNDGSLTLCITCAWDVADQIQDTLQDATRGEIQFDGG